MIRNILNIIFGIALLVKASSCCLDTEDLPTHDLSSSDMEWTNPYAVGATFKFRNEVGDERLYRVDSIVIDQYDNGGAEMLCPTYKYNLWRAWMSSPNDTLHIPSLFELSKPDSIENCYLEWDNLHSSIPVYYFETDTSLIRNTNAELIDNLEVNGTSYNDVFRVLTWQSIDTTSTQIKALFYDKENGVVRFDLMNGEKWERQ